MKITKRTSGYKVEVYDPAKKSKKRYVGTFPTEREAKQEGRKAEDLVARRRGRKTSQTVGEFMPVWLARLERRIDDPQHPIKASTVETYREQVERFEAFHGGKDLDEVTPELALNWLLGDEDRPGQRWTLGGLRTMFAAARVSGLIDSNPFAGLGIKRGAGRKNLDVLSIDEVRELATRAHQAWPTPEIAQMMHALITCAAFLGMRPAELYGLRWSDIDWSNEEVHVERQYSAKTRTYTKPKNGLSRTIVLLPDAYGALRDLPRPIDPDALVFRASRGGPMTGRVQHYYWHPIRVAFGDPTMHLYELRHFCGSYLLNDLELPQQDVAEQLGHTDGGALVMKLYGHPSATLARKRIKERMRGATVTPIAAPAREAVGQ